MAQALLDLTYYKCGHCLQKFNSLVAFGKHQREIHTPKHAPNRKPTYQAPVEKKADEPATENNLDEKAIKEEENDQPTDLLQDLKKDNRHNNFEFILKLKLCHKCAMTVGTKGKKLQVHLCSLCFAKNQIL